MTKVRTYKEQDEPVGIVITSGAREEVTPRFAAFVWGPAPDADALTEVAEEAKAA